MAEIIKYGANECKQHIKHDLRELPAGKHYGNESVDTSLSHLNYSLIDRGKNAEEVNAYRLQLEKEIFKYNRKNLVHSVEVVIQLPEDCPPEHEKEFFRESYNYVVSKLPMGEKCVVVAEVHKDEHKFVNGVDISKPHLHVMYVPGVPDEKHDGYSYKLCADALTKRAALKSFHPGLQKHLEEKNIPGTVYQKKEGDGKTIALSVSQLKEITDKTGIVLKKSITVDQLAEILKENENVHLHDKELESKIALYEKKIDHLNESVKERDKTISHLTDESKSKDAELEKLRSKTEIIDTKTIHDVAPASVQIPEEIEYQKINDTELKLKSYEKEIDRLRYDLRTKETEISKLAEESKVKDLKIEELKEKQVNYEAPKEKDVSQDLELSHKKISELLLINAALEKELEAVKEKLEEHEQNKVVDITSRDPSWGTSHSWGNDKTWGNTTLSREEEKLW